jgi:hypothetical protein
MVFPGSTMWHLRRNSAGAINLYLKCNTFECDPLEEDPATRRRLQYTEAFLAGGDLDLEWTIPALSRQLEWTGPLAGRDWQKRLFAKLWDRRPFPLCETDLLIMRSVDGRTRWGELAPRLDGDRKALDDRLVRLARRGAVDFVEEVAGR